MDEPTILVCGSKSFFKDDLHGKCACGRAIVYRPHSPQNARRVCTVCGIVGMIKDKPSSLFASTKTIKEVKDYLEKRHERERNRHRTD